MNELSERRLAYPMPHPAALRTGLLMGVAMGAAKVLSGRIGTGLILIAMFTGAGYAVARWLLKTVVHRRGFTIRGWQEFDWSDVSDAEVSSGALRMDLRKGGAAELPRAIAEDSGFREAVRGWLAVEHPVRRAIDPPAGS